MIKRFRRTVLSEYSRDILLLALGGGISAGAYLGMMQLVRVLYVLRLGFGPQFVGTLTATGALSFSFASLLGGALGGRLGAKRMMVTGSALMLLGMLLVPLTELAPENWRRGWILASEGVANMGWSWVVVNQVPALSALTTPANRKSAFALREACAGGGMFLGALLGGVVPGTLAGLLRLDTTSPEPFRLSLWLSVAAVALALVPFIAIRPAQVSRSTRVAGKAPLPLWPLVLLLISGFFNNGAVASGKTFSAAYLDQVFALPAWLIGAITSAGMCLSVLGALSGPRLARRGGGSLVMRGAALILGVSLLQMGLLPLAGTAALGAMVVQGISSIFVPAFQVMQMELTPPERRGLVAGASFAIMSLGYGLVSLSGGYLVASVGYSWLFLIGAGMAACCAAIVGLVQRRLAAHPRPDEN